MVLNGKNRALSPCVHRQISPPLTAADESFGRSVPSIGLSSDVGDSLSGASGISLAVAEWIIDPRQVWDERTNPHENLCNEDIVRTRANRALSEIHRDSTKIQA